MDLDPLLRHYLGDAEAALADPAQVEAAGERIAIDFAVERDAGRRFALWALLHMLGRAPDPDTAFKDPRERRAAHDFARMMTRAQDREDAADDGAG